MGVANWCFGPSLHLPKLHQHRFHLSVPLIVWFIKYKLSWELPVLLVLVSIILVLQNKSLDQMAHCVVDSWTSSSLFVLVRASISFFPCLSSLSNYIPSNKILCLWQQLCGILYAGQIEVWGHQRGFTSVTAYHQKC